MHYEAPVCQHLHYETHHVSIRDGPKQFQVESTVPHGVICSCQVQKHYPAFSLCSKLSSMYCVSIVTWPTVYLPWRKQACSRGSRWSTTGSMRLCNNLSRILNGMQSREMSLYDLGVMRRLIGFWKGHDGSMAPGIWERGSS